MEIFMDDEFLYSSMEKCIEQALDALVLVDIRPAKSPINAPIEVGSPLDRSLRRKFMMAVGCIGWLVNTGRPDVSHAHSRVAQHMASPTTSAMYAVKRIMAHLTSSWLRSRPLAALHCVCRLKHSHTCERAFIAWAITSYFVSANSE